MGLLELLKDKDARKIFGEREIKIIEKQLWGINLTQSEKNRLSRDIRKKLKIIEKLARFEKEFELKKGSKIKQIVGEVKETILQDKNDNLKKIKKIILYGSAVENKLTFKSDIDIAVEFEEISKKNALKFRIDIMGKISDKVDIQVYNILPEKIKKEIDEKGKVLYEK